MKSKKKIIALALSMLLLLTAFVAATFAYFTDNESVTNTLTVGNVQIDLFESQYVVGEDGKTVEDAKLDDATYRTEFLKNESNTNIMPGKIIPKNTYIENTGKNSAYVRFFITIPDEFVGKVTNAPVDTSKNALILNFNETDFTVDKTREAEGIYIVTYKNVLDPTEVTSNGLVSIQLNPYLTSAQFEELLATDAFNENAFDVDVRAEAIQEYGFDTSADAFEQFNAAAGI